MMNNQQSDVIFQLYIDFGHDKSSPIPSVIPEHKNKRTVIAAIPHSGGLIFPGERYETIEFLDYLVDEAGEPCGIKCIVRDYPEKVEEFLLNMGYDKCPVQELELYVNKPKNFQSSSYENGVNLRIFRHFELQEYKPKANTKN
ncbi:MAG: hypothetical protein IJ744_00040 [Lachnospiraceae bacterium]|nr:hypothetical protein [Lachnospiraceae bacterium]